MRTVTLLVFTLATISWSDAQTQLTSTPVASPSATVSQTIGLTKVTVIYNRPAVKDREIWGQLVPYGKIWRAGANENTIFECSTDVTIEGKSLPAGKYGLHLLVNESDAEVIFSKNYTSWGSYSYDAAEDMLRVKITPVTSEHFYEWLTYSFDDLTHSATACNLNWGDRQFSFEVGAEVHEIVIASLQNELRDKAGWSWQGWNEAAGYCLQNEVELQLGLNWAARSVFINPNPDNMLTKARINAKVQGIGDPEAEKDAIIASLQTDLDAGNVTWREYNGAANYALGAGRRDQALAWANSAVAMADNMTSKITKVKILKEKEMHQEAEKIKVEAIAQGSNAELNQYGYSLLFSGEVEGAIEIFEANAEKHGHLDPNVWDSLGEGYVKAGMKDKAIKAFKKCLSMDPQPWLRSHSENFLKQLGVKIEEM